MPKKPNIEITETKQLPGEVVKQMLTLATSGFGLVSALAWNEVIKDLIDNYVKPYLPSGSSILSRLLYAMIVTSLAVIVTLQLSKLQQKFPETKPEKSKPKS